MTVEYFEIKDPKDFYIGRWLKKPNTKKLLESQKLIIIKGIKLTIGIDLKIINKILLLFNKYDICVNDTKRDLSKISCETELPVSLIKVVLQGKGVIE